MKMAGDPGFGALVLDRLGDFPERYGLTVTRHNDGWLQLAMITSRSPSCTIGRPIASCVRTDTTSGAHSPTWRSFVGYDPTS